MLTLLELQEWLHGTNNHRDVEIAFYRDERKTVTCHIFNYDDENDEISIFVTAKNIEKALMAAFAQLIILYPSPVSVKALPRHAGKSGKRTLRIV